MKNERLIQGIYQGAPFHWVGDGFRVSNFFPANDFGPAISPFVLLDYAAPHVFAPTTSTERGVGPHPHRGFETVTIVFEGHLAHHDSAGNSGVIGPGDAQWMTAAAGVVHSEYHEKNFALSGGRMHAIQLWVNLPAAHKMDKPRYQTLEAAGMGRVELPDGAGQVRVIAGSYQGVSGPAHTVTPVTLFDVRMNAGAKAAFPIPAPETAGVLVMQGEVAVNGSARAKTGDFVLFANQGEEFTLEAASEFHALVLGGEPIHEPVVQYGPFVMNTADEIRQAIRDFNSGRF